ncbi:hypothetical protein GBAR_LOCUS1503, partial [Geodia barretti]
MLGVDSRDRINEVQQQCSSISGLNDLHITQRRSLHIHIHNAEHPH